MAGPAVSSIAIKSETAFGIINNGWWLDIYLYLRVIKVWGMWGAAQYFSSLSADVQGYVYVIKKLNLSLNRL